jgi:hypothetical protein
MPKEADKSPSSPRIKRGDWQCSCGTLNKGGFGGSSSNWQVLPGSDFG